MSPPTPNDSPRPFYTVAEVAELLRVNAMTIYRAIREDGFPRRSGPLQIRHPGRRY